MNEQDTIQLNLPASLKYLNVLGECVVAMLEKVDGVTNTSETIYSIQLAVHEVCTNIVDHAYAGQPEGRIEIILSIIPGPNRFIAKFCDNGHAFDWNSVPSPNLQEGQERGYGLFLVKELMDNVTYQPQSGSNRWQLVKNL